MTDLSPEKFTPDHSFSLSDSIVAVRRIVMQSITLLTRHQLCMEAILAFITTVSFNYTCIKISNLFIYKTTDFECHLLWTGCNMASCRVRAISIACTLHSKHICSYCWWCMLSILLFCCSDKIVSSIHTRDDCI